LFLSRAGCELRHPAKAGLPLAERMVGRRWQSSDWKPLRSVCDSLEDPIEFSSDTLRRLNAALSVPRQRFGVVVFGGRTN
jgi:hypothetical protein